MAMSKVTASTVNTLARKVARLERKRGRPPGPQQQAHTHRLGPWLTDHELHDMVCAAPTPELEALLDMLNRKEVGRKPGDLAAVLEWADLDGLPVLRQLLQQHKHPDLAGKPGLVELTPS